MDKTESIEKILEILDNMEKNEENSELIDEIKELLNKENLKKALSKLQKLKELKKTQEEEEKQKEKELEEAENEEYDEFETVDIEDVVSNIKLKTEDDDYVPDSTFNIDEDFGLDVSNGMYPKLLLNPELEKIYLGLLLANPKAITMYYFLYDECLFANDKLLEIYKSILFTEGSNYSSELAKKDFNFSKVTPETNMIKLQLRTKIRDKRYDFEKIYTELKKIFILRKHYRQMPIKETQDEIAGIVKYKLYDIMTVEEVEAAINQILATEKFKRSVLNKDVTEFLLKGENTLTTGLPLPFPILTSVFKGMRRGETMAFAMPSNSGKSRFTINLACKLAFELKRKVLIISNEMSEEKMKLCLITTIINNPDMQKLHGQKLVKTEGELLEFQFRPNPKAKVKTDENGYMIPEKGESRKDFVERLKKYSDEFNKTTAVTDWLNKELNNSIYFINITDHTNDELKKVISNYYYKEKIEYMFYDTMKTDIDNIGNTEEIKKTATLLSNMAQNFNIFIGYSMQLKETPTLPINVSINDLSVSKTVKEVLDTLCLVKQISNKALKDYEYSLNEVDTKFYQLKQYKDPDERYYACVVDKNRAGSKPKVLFNLNLAYNRWIELGYLKLKNYIEYNEE